MLENIDIPPSVKYTFMGGLAGLAVAGVDYLKGESLTFLIVVAKVIASGVTGLIIGKLLAGLGIGSDLISAACGVGGLIGKEIIFSIRKIGEKISIAIKKFNIEIIINNILRTILNNLIAYFKK